MMEVLKEVYQKCWCNYISNIRNNPDIKPANPFLIAVPSDYQAKTKKVMICGQETQGWGNEFDTNPDSATIDALLQLYEGFANNGGYNSPYWQFVNSLKKDCPDVGFVCNNIVKIGKKCGPGCDDEINDLTLKYFPVIPEELEILKPDMILFLTGPNYDCRIKKTLGNFSIKQIGNIKKFDELIFDNSSLPKAFRCYHPGYLRRCRQEKTIHSYITRYLNDL